MAASWVVFPECWLLPLPMFHFVDHRDRHAPSATFPLSVG